eukprot:CAMPEP_0196776832 /NCGR_PEP_ID=MMETSP1104-20130614/4869_1 /TAXON_ID=33652 /ORGANISM="Cafeteria sp., Strain Caron Lab Isolate" /LENGTH=90 /DNA_ID=CAMNT_0042146999 /DNA_START=12 /DNA_END=281 /DNA_ORIENTATION=-
MWHAPVSSEIKIPCKLIQDPFPLHAAPQHVIVMLACATTNEFTHSWDEEIHGLDDVALRGWIPASAHVEGLHRSWVVRHEHGLPLTQRFA